MLKPQAEGLQIRTWTPPIPKIKLCSPHKRCITIHCHSPESRTVVYSSIPWCIIFRCLLILFCSITSCCIMLYYVALCRIMLHSITFSYDITLPLYFVVSYYVTWEYILLWYTTWRDSIWHSRDFDLLLVFVSCCSCVGMWTITFYYITVYHTVSHFSFSFFIACHSFLQLIMFWLVTT